MFNDFVFAVEAKHQSYIKTCINQMKMMLVHFCRLQFCDTFTTIWWGVFVVGCIVGSFKRWPSGPSAPRAAFGSQVMVVQVVVVAVVAVATVVAVVVAS